MFLMRQYEFKIEFYDIQMQEITDTIKTLKDGKEVLENVKKIIPVKNPLQLPNLNSEPRFILQTKNGAPYFTYTTSHQYSQFSCFTSEQGTLKIYNLPLDFNETVKMNWGIKLWVRYLADDLIENPWYLVTSGRIWNPEETDFPNGDFEIKYDVKSILSLDRDWLNKAFPQPIQLKGKTVGQAITEIYGDRAISYLNETESNTVIDKNMAVDSPSDFQYKITRGDPAYVSGIIQDKAPPNVPHDVVMVFLGSVNLSSESEYEDLEKHGLIFIPQQSKQFNEQFNYFLTFWNWGRCRVKHCSNNSTRLVFAKKNWQSARVA